MSDVPFTLVLRQYRGIERKDWSKVNSWDLLAAHIDLTVDGNVSELLDKLEGLNMLVMPEVNGLPNPRRQPGFRRFAFIQDPDGLVLEYFSKPIPKPGDPPAPPTVSNSSATGANMDRLGKQAGFNHYAYNIIDPRKAQDFYVKVLGGDYPPIESTSGAQVMLHGWFPQATTKNNLRVELIYFALNNGKTPPPVKFQDINANYGGFQVSNIETAYARAKAMARSPSRKAALSITTKGAPCCFAILMSVATSCSGSLRSKHYCRPETILSASLYRASPHVL